MLIHDLCPATVDSPHHLHDVRLFQPFGARTRDEFCCRCGFRQTVTLDVVDGEKADECGPFLRVYQSPPPKAA